MNAIVSGRSGRALLLDGESLKSFDLDDPSTIVPRRRSDLPYLFGEAADLRTIENTTIEVVECELRMDCHFTWALDLALISLDSEVEDDIRTDALEDLQELLTDGTTALRLESVLYAKPLPEDADLRGALDLCNPETLSTVFQFLSKLEERQPSITSVRHAFEIIPTNTFGGQENREAFEKVAVKEGLFHGLVTRAPAASISTFLAKADRNPSVQRLPNHRQVLQSWTRPFRGLSLIEILKQALRTFPVRCALLLGIIATTLAVVAGINSDYRIAVFGAVIMFVLFVLVVVSVSFSSPAIHSTNSIRPLASSMAWIFVLVTAATSFCIFTGFFFDFPRPLEAYLYPLPTPSPSPTVGPSPTPLISTPTIVITEVPPKGAGPDRVETIAGKVVGVKKDECKVVIFARTDVWYVQPYITASDTSIDDAHTWRSDTHLGSQYAALLVKNSYQPPSTTGRLPEVGGPVLAIVTADAK